MHGAGSAILRAAAHPAAAALLEGLPVDPHADPLKSIDMTQLHRCIQMHACLQKIPSLQARTLHSLNHPRLCQLQRWPKSWQQIH